MGCRAKQQAKAAEAEEERLLAEEYQALLAEQDAARQAALAATSARSAVRAEQAGSGVLEAAKVLVLLVEFRSMIEKVITHYQCRSNRCCTVAAKV